MSIFARLWGQPEDAEAVSRRQAEFDKSILQLKTTEEQLEHLLERIDEVGRTTKVKSSELSTSRSDFNKTACKSDSYRPPSSSETDAELRKLDSLRTSNAT